jgi:hypothetical protein
MIELPNYSSTLNPPSTGKTLVYVNGSGVLTTKDSSGNVTTFDVSGKQDALVSGTSIKTINSTSLLGSGNIDAGDVFATGSDNQLSRQMLIDCGYTFLDKGNSSTTTQTLDYTAGSHQKITATGDFTIALSNFPPTGNLGEMLLELVNGGAFTITLPTVNWIKPDGSTTTTWSTYLAANTGRTALQSSGTDFFLIWSRDGGSNYYGRLV